jgi:hypothetical protein
VPVGVREARMGLGDHILPGEDILTARKLEDGIARGNEPFASDAGWSTRTACSGALARSAG